MFTVDKTKYHMDDQELQGRINGIAMALEIALVEAFAISRGQRSEAARVVRGELTGIIESQGLVNATDPFHVGTRDGLQLIVDRLQGLYPDSE